jgi:hypothetical protein
MTNKIEPTIVYPEAAFETALLDLVRACCHAQSAAVVPRFGLDIAVFDLSDRANSAVFIEAKSYGAQRPGGCGFGNGRGEGPQVQLLLLEGAQLDVLDEFVRWAFVDATRPHGSDRYALLTCREAKSAAMGSIASGKQNNFRMSAITPHLVTWPVFSERLVEFVRAGSSSSAIG